MYYYYTTTVPLGKPLKPLANGKVSPVSCVSNAIVFSFTATGYELELGVWGWSESESRGWI